MADEESRILSIEAINAKLDNLIHSLSGGGDAPAKREPAHATGLQSQIDEAVARATESERSRTAAEQRSSATEKRIAELEARTEKKPVERRPLTKLFWGSDE